LQTVGRQAENSDELRQLHPVLIRPVKAEVFQASIDSPAIRTVSPAIFLSARIWSGIVAIDVAHRGLAGRARRPAVVDRMNDA
jgi:hypothetical protein